MKRQEKCGSMFWKIFLIKETLLPALKLATMYKVNLLENK